MLTVIRSDLAKGNEKKKKKKMQKGQDNRQD